MFRLITYYWPPSDLKVYEVCKRHVLDMIISVAKIGHRKHLWLVDKTVPSPLFRFGPLKFLLESVFNLRKTRLKLLLTNCLAI